MPLTLLPTTPSTTCTNTHSDKQLSIHAIGNSTGGRSVAGETLVALVVGNVAPVDLEGKLLGVGKLSLKSPRTSRGGLQRMLLLLLFRGL